MSILETFPNLVEMFFTRAAAKSDAPFLWHKAEGTWTSLSWAAAADQVARITEGLRSLGMRPGDRVMLVSENRPEWCLADLGIMAAGCVTVPTYVTNTERDHAHVVENSGARAAIVSTAKLARTLLPALARSSACDTLIALEPVGTGRVGAVQIHDWSSLLARQPGDVSAVRSRVTAKRRDLACIIYTSGTGGAPRGVRQHHGAILQNVNGCMTIIAEDFRPSEEIFLSLLPLSHAYEHSGGQHLPIGLGGQIYYSEGIDKLAANIEEVKPTIMIVVPRLFELLRGRILKTIEKDGGLPKWLLAKALELGAKDRVGLLDKPLDLLLSATIRPKIGKRFGGRMKALVSGGAPLNPEVGQFFAALGLTILQGYGQTEAGPVISCNRPKAGIDHATVGPPLEGTEVRIAADGEILVRGECVMAGYWNNDAESARVIADGWLHTGDIGEIDDAGRIRITDRKKDLIINDKGENVAPQRIEGMLTLEPEIGQAMVAGDRRPHLVGLIEPDIQWMAEWSAANNVPLTEARTAPGLHRALMAAVDRVNAGLSVTEKVRRILITDEPFGIENGEMTPSLKIRRHVIRARYGDRLNALYKA